MNTQTAAVLLLATPVLTAIGQLLLRAGMKEVTATGDGAAITAVLSNAFSHPSVLAGLFVYGLCSVLWMLLLGRFELSYAYPFVGLSFVVALALGALFLDEALSPLRIVGTMVVAAGVAMVASS